MYKSVFLYWAAKLYNYFIYIGENLKSLFLLYMRVTWGHQFFLVGLHKLQSIDAVVSSFVSLHIPYPTFHAYLVGIVELVCGFLIFVGLGSRIAAIPLTITMFVALSLVHAPSVSQLHFLLEPASLVREPPYPFLITSLMVFCFGPGRVSLDAWLKRWVERQPKY